MIDISNNPYAIRCFRKMKAALRRFKVMSRRADTKKNIQRMLCHNNAAQRWFKKLYPFLK